MQLAIEKPLTDFERGQVTRRLASTRVPDLHRTLRFYQEFVGMPLKEQLATVHMRDPAACGAEIEMLGVL